jgi:hypothetical protein
MRKSAWAGLAVLLAGGMAWSQTYVISTVAGGGVPFTPAPASSVGLASPVGVATDGAGNVYFSSGNLVFKVDGTGSLTRVAGNGKAGYSGDAGPAAEAQLNSPQGVALDTGGTLYIADTGNNVVRRVTPDGTITTVAGGVATATQLNAPAGVALDDAGNLYIADTRNCVIREVTAAGAMVTVAGTSGSCGFSGDGGAPVACQLNNPAGLAVVPGALYIADTGNDAIRMVGLGQWFSVGTITTVAGTGGLSGYDGDGGAATRARLNAPSSVALDAGGNLLISDGGNNAIRKVSFSSGIITTIAGTSKPGFAGDGGPAVSAQLWAPWGVATDSAGDIFIGDTLNYRVREIGTDGNIATLAGSGTNAYRGDSGPATGSQLAQPKAVAVDSAGNLYIADTFGNTVRKVAADGTITTVAGTGIRGYSGDGGPATAAQLNRPRGIVVDSSGNVYIADTDNQRVRKVTTDGNIATYAGNGTPAYGGDTGLATDAWLSSPCGLALDSSGNLYIADLQNNVIREVTVSDGDISTVAGAYNAGYFGDGGKDTSALLNSPSSVALDSAGNLYIADYYNHAIRKVSVSTALISTVAGNGTPGYSGDAAAATSAQLNLPWGLAVDSSGNIFIGDSGNNVIREVTSGGNIATVAGNHTAGYSGDAGPAASAQLNGPAGVVVSTSGNVYIADTNNNVIRLLSTAGSHAVLSVSATHSGSFQPGQTTATYSLSVSNAAGAGPTSGTVTVTATPSVGQTVGSMSGTGWTCSANTCTRGDALAAGASYPAITVTVSVTAGTGSSVAIQVAVTGGGSAGASATDAAAVLGAPSAPVLLSPANGVGAVSTAVVLSWSDSGATSYQVYFGTLSTPPLVATVSVAGYAPAGLSPGTTYYWQVVAVNAVGTASSPVWSFTTGLTVAGLQFVAVTPCRVADTRGAAGPFGGPTLAADSTRSFAIPQSACNIPPTALAYSLNVTAVPDGDLPYLTLWPAGLTQPGVSTLNSFDGNVTANAAIVPAGTGGGVSVFAAGQTDVILDIDGYFAPTGGASFYTVAPCRVADTRGETGQFGGPSMFGGQTRDFPIPAGPCAIPSNAGAYSLNVTAVPDPIRNYLGYLSAWATGQQQPLVSTLNSWTGTIVANAAIVPAGTNGSVSVFVTDPANVVLDANGYFAPPGSTGALSFYPMAPCRVADTRSGQILAAGSTTPFAIPASSCYVPPMVAAYSLNFTVVPQGPLSYLTAWPTGATQPFVSTLNALDGNVTANAAIVPAGASGAISVYVTNPTHVIVDINGYFAP